MYIHVLPILIIPTEIAPVENLMVTDQCTIIRANWSISEGPCTDLLSYNVTLTSSDGDKLQGTTSDTDYDFTNVELQTLNGPFNVTVVPINGNSRGDSVTAPSDIGVSPNG